MEYTHVDHIGIAVQSLEQALVTFRDRLGLQVEQIVEVPEQRVRVAFLPVGQTTIELLEPTSPDSPIAHFLERRGEGIHHVALGVSSIEEALEALKRQEVRLVDEHPRQGAEGLIAFLHPKATHGALIELVEREGTEEAQR